MQHPDIEENASKNAPTSPDRREFMKKTGRFAVATPPAVAFLLSTSLASEAVAKSGGGRWIKSIGPGRKRGFFKSWFSRF